MKKILNVLVPSALMLAGILVGCSKSDSTPENNTNTNTGTNTDTETTIGAAPSISWAANPNFEDTYLAETMDVNLTVTAEEGIETFVVDVDSQILGSMLSLLGIGTSMDIINDDAAIAMLSELGVPTGDDLYGKTSVNFSLSTLIPLIYALGPEAGSQHKFTVTVTDPYEQSVSKTLTFIMPETEDTTPTITWVGNEDSDTMELAEEMDIQLTVTAPEGIATFTVDIDSPTLNTILTYVLGIGTHLDLIYGEESTLATLSGLGLLVGDDLYGQTEVTFELSSLVPMIYTLGPDSGSEHKFTLAVSDMMGQSVEKTLTFVMP